MKRAFMFAGQGSQKPGMGKDLYSHFPRFAEVIDSAENIFPGLKELMFEDDGTRLSETRYTQPALAAFAAGVTAVLADAGIRPDCAAGLSLGEYSALHAAGVFDLETLIRVTAFRGEAMQQAAEQTEACMSAILGLTAEQVQNLCASASAYGLVSPANYNSPLQTVIAGVPSAVTRAEALAQEAGAKRCIRLNVSSGFHTELMSPAAAALHEKFQETAFGELQIPVIFNVTAKPLMPGETIPELLERQVKSPVQMTGIIHYLAEAGIEEVVEIGPGRAISGFVRKTEKGIRTAGIETVEEMERFFEEK